MSLRSDRQSELPDLSYHIYVYSLAVPGDPREDTEYLGKFLVHKLIDAIWEHNSWEIIAKKYVFFVCHSFQMACQAFWIVRNYPS